MVPQIGPFFWGLPKRYMNSALLWNPSEQDSIERRPGFPTWSWAGWKGFRNNMGFPHRIDKIPLEIAFFELQINAKTNEVVPQPVQQRGQMFSLASRFKGDVSLTDVAEISSRYVAGSLPIIKIMQLLVFYTHSAKLRVDMEPFFASTYKVLGANRLIHPEIQVDERVIPELHSSIDELIELDPEWRKRQPAELEFIEMYHVPGNKYIRLMLIEWKDNVAYRVVLLRKPVNYRNWLACRPTEKLVFLG